MTTKSDNATPGPDVYLFIFQDAMGINATCAFQADWGTRTLSAKTTPRDRPTREWMPLWFCVTSNLVSLVSPGSFVGSDFIVGLEMGDFFCAGHVNVRLLNKTV